MRSLTFTKYSPSGNITLLVHTLQLDAVARARTATELMRKDHVHAEQVAYVDSKAKLPRLEMMGGELCVNACRAFAAHLHHEDRLQTFDGSDWKQGQIVTSGAQAPLMVRARKTLDDFETAVELPLEPETSVQTLDKDVYLVCLPGISHLVLLTATHPEPVNWKEAARDLRKKYRLEKDDAVGCLWLTHYTSRAHLLPAVWVRACKETILENACGSGSLACALVLRMLKGHEQAQSYDIMQPSGEEISIDIIPEIWGHSAWVRGKTRCIARGEAYVTQGDL